MKRPGLVIAIASSVAVLIGTITYAQFGGGQGRPLRGGGFGAEPIMPNAAYDGKFTFVRMRYGPAVGYASQRVMWSHDYPTGEQNFMKILNELTYLGPHIAETNIMSFGDPEVFKYPIAYICEPGPFFTLTDEEAVNFRSYLLKGGFAIVDDFRAAHWEYFEEQMRRILPEVKFFDLEESHPIFHSFFDITDISNIPNYYDQQFGFNGGRPVFRGIYENNDPSKRLMAIINYNTDISEFWEFSATGLKPLEESNEAYKLGVNYVIYGLTH